MAEEIFFENSQISNFEGLVTLTLNSVTLRTFVHHLSTSTYMPNFIEIEETFYGWTYERTHADGRTYVRTYIRHGRTDIWNRFIRSTLSKSRPNYLYKHNLIQRKLNTYLIQKASM